MNRVMTLSVPGTGERLDRFLAQTLTDLSRNAVQSLIRDARVQVNGQVGRASRRLRTGDSIRIELPPPRSLDLEPESWDLSVVFEDQDLVVIDKPAGLVVHPGAGVRHGTLVHALLHRYPEIAVVGGPGRPGIVHRLDKDTSGLMVVARSARAYLGLVEALHRRTVKRTYGALVWGDPGQDSGTVEAALGRDPRERKRMSVVSRGGKPARTLWRVVERFGLAARLELNLDTGRTHQIRVHMAHLGHPVVGDATYGGRVKKMLSLREPQRSLAIKLLGRLPRQALHALELQFLHPVTSKPLSFSSPWPNDVREAIELLSEGGS